MRMDTNTVKQIVHRYFSVSMLLFCSVWVMIAWKTCNGDPITLLQASFMYFSSGWNCELPLEYNKSCSKRCQTYLEWRRGVQWGLKNCGWLLQLTMLWTKLCCSKNQCNYVTTMLEQIKLQLGLTWLLVCIILQINSTADIKLLKSIIQCVYNIIHKSIIICNYILSYKSHFLVKI